MMSLSGALKPSAVAGRPSVTRFTHSSCTGLSTSGSPGQSDKHARLRFSVANVFRVRLGTGLLRHHLKLAFLSVCSSCNPGHQVPSGRHDGMQYVQGMLA